MITVSQKQASQRWDTITPQLREALFSDVNADFIWNLCQSEHLTEEMSYEVAEISGYVLLGLLHPDDLAGELVSSMDLPAPLAKTISDQINSRVFAPLRADIDKVYSPPSKLGGSLIGSAPKILQDIGISPRPITLSDIGWSKQPAAGSNIGRGAAIPVPIPAPKPPAEPAPMMLHEDTIFKPAEKNASFTLSKPEGAAEVNMNRGVAAQAPTRPAVLEFGGSAASAGTPVPKPPTPASNFARPMSFGPSFASMPTANSGSRNVSQVMPTTTVPVPVPPRPQQVSPAPLSRVPQPPKPPAPQNAASTSQPNKPIVKDFL